MEPTPAVSKTDPPLARAKPISAGGRASVTMNLQRGKEPLVQQQLQPERGVRIRERNTSAETKVIEEGGGEGAPGTRDEIALKPMEKTVVRQVVPLKPVEVQGGADIHLYPVGRTPRGNRRRV